MMMWIEKQITIFLVEMICVRREKSPLPSIRRNNDVVVVVVVIVFILMVDGAVVRRPEIGGWTPVAPPQQVPATPRGIAGGGGVHRRHRRAEGGTGAERTMGGGRGGRGVEGRGGGRGGGEERVERRTSFGFIKKSHD